ncbi:hypothetical protein ABMA58_00100 [Oceanospirillum sp. HFRX-1_2]
MIHCSPREIKEGMINHSGIAGDCLFFSNNAYDMSAGSVTYVYEADFNCVRVRELYDEEIIAEIAERFNCDEGEAERLLDGRANEWDFDGCEGYDSWWLQGKRGECAVKMGYDGCEDWDEQGTVFIVPMFGREAELNLIEVCK